MMGYIRHNAIVVTSWNADAIEAAACRARNIGLTVVGPSAELINGYRSLLVCPDGSKEGWSDSEQGDEMRAELRDWMNARRHDDGSSYLEWVEIAYGSDSTAEIEATAWMQPNRINSAAPIGVGWNDVLGDFLENTMRDDYYYSGQYAEEQAEAEAQAKEGAHRQGKWHVSEHTDGRDALVYDADGFEVARVCYPNRDADARLIAVVPELLAAAQAALHYMRLHKYADQAWADDLEAAITQAMTPNKEVSGPL